MADRPVVILGAGASCAEGGPSLRELLSTALANPDERSFEYLPRFLVEHFGGPDVRDLSLPLVLGFLDCALDRKHSLGRTWDLDSLRAVRGEIEFCIFKALGRLEAKTSNYQSLVRWLSEGTREPTIVSLNYDVLADAALISHSVRVPEYGCEIGTKGYAEQEKFGRLFKLVGSLHWLYCPACHWLEVKLYRKDMTPSVPLRAGPALLVDAYTPTGYACPREGCGAAMRPVIVTPTPIQEHINPHIEQVRYAAERALSQADAAIFIGYSMRLSDLAIIYLIKRGLAHLDPSRITVVAGGDDWVHGNYKQTFGPRIRCEPLDFSGWMRKVQGEQGTSVAQL